MEEQVAGREHWHCHRIRSDIFVLDVDGEVGKASLRDLKAQHSPLPKTVTVKTGKGRHYYFRCDSARVPNWVGHPAKGIDVRGDGGYVVAAGSVHVSGATYRFVHGRGLDEVEVAPAPAWLLALVTGAAETAGKTEKVLPNVIPVPAAKLDRARGYAEAARQQEVDRVLDESEIHPTIASGLTSRSTRSLACGRPDQRLR